MLGGGKDVLMGEHQGLKFLCETGGWWPSGKRITPRAEGKKPRKEGVSGDERLRQQKASHQRSPKTRRNITIVEKKTKRSASRARKNFRLSTAWARNGQVTWGRKFAPGEKKPTK